MVLGNPTVSIGRATGSIVRLSDFPILWIKRTSGVVPIGSAMMVVRSVQFWWTNLMVLVPVFWIAERKVLDVFEVGLGAVGAVGQKLWPETVQLLGSELVVENHCFDFADFESLLFEWFEAPGLKQ